MSVGADPRVGSELAGYRIEVLLGRGGMADVYRAVDLRLGRPVALKLLAPDLAEDERFRERFLRESRLAASLDHPNVIPIYEAGEVEGLLYIAMRYVEGTDLKKLLQQEGRLDPRRALFLLGRIADALDAAHARGLVHRDVKPGNVLIAVDPKADPAEHPYLSDFGLTKQTSSDSGITQTGQFVGTADYAAPEQITRGPIGPATDQYALACLLHECLTGNPPYRNDALMAVLWAHVNDPPPKASEQNHELPKALDPVLARGLAKEPKQRYASCRDLVANAREALGISSAELPVAPATTTLLLGRREFLIAAGALVATAVAVPAVLLTRGGGGGAPGLAPRNSLARIDLASNEITQVVADLASPWAFAVGEGAAWSLSRERHSVTRIDPATGSTTVTSIPGLPYWIAAGEGAVWVTTSFEGRGYLLEVSPGSAKIDNRYALPQADPLAVVVSDGNIWIACHDFLRGESVILRYPPKPVLEGNTARPISTLAGIDPPWWTTITDWFAVSGGTISILTGRPGASDKVPTFRQFDAETGNETLAVPLEGPEALAVGPASVWVTQLASTVWEISVPSGVLTKHTDWVTLDTGPILYAHDSLWIGDLTKNVLRKVDPATGEVVAAIQVAEPQPTVKAGAPYVYAETKPFFNGLRTDAESVWAEIGSYPGNII